MSNPDGATLPATFTMDYNCGTGYTGQVPVAYPTPGFETVPGIPTGNTCTVTEVAPATITDYTWGWPPTYTPASQVIATQGQTYEIVVGNSITKNRGSLVVTKTVNWNGVTPDTTKTFQICVSGTSYGPDCKMADYDGGILTWGTLLPGDYTVTETDPGALWSVTGSPQTVAVPAGGTGTATITNARRVPAIDVTKTANPTSVPETGGNVTFTFLVKNTGPVDVTLTSLTDTVFGDLTAYTGTTCVLPQTLAAVSGSYSCSITKWLASDTLTPHSNTITATAADAGGATATDNDSETVTFTDVRSYLSVTKSVSSPTLPEPGGDFAYSALITNPAGNVDDITVSAVTDSIYGGAISCTPVLPVTLAPGESMTCTFTANHTGNAGDSWTNHVNATATDDDGKDASAQSNDVTVSLTDVLSLPLTIVKSVDHETLPEPGGDFAYSALITNPAGNVDDITVSAVTDSIYGGAISCTPALPNVLSPGESMTCTFTANHTGNAGDSWTNHVNATATDDDGRLASADSNDVTVSLTNVLPTITVAKSANPTSLPEPGGNVEFTVVVTNNSFEPVTLTGLTDDVYGNLNGQGTCATGGTIAADASYTCVFTGAVTGEPGSYTDTVTAVATDNDGTTDTKTDDATVTLTDVLPAVTLNKAAFPTTMPEPGGAFLFTLDIKNDSVEPVTITALTDDNALSDECLALIGTTLAAGASTSCQYWVTHTEAGSYANTASVTSRTTRATRPRIRTTRRSRSPTSCRRWT